MRKTFAAATKGTEYHDLYQGKTAMMIVEQDASDADALRTIAEQIAAMRKWNMHALELAHVSLSSLVDAHSPARQITDSLREQLVEVFVVSRRAWKACDGRQLSLLCAEDIENANGRLDSGTKDALQSLVPLVRSVGRVALVEPGDILAEIESIRGKGLLLVDERRLTFTPLAGVHQEELFRLVYEEHTTGPYPSWKIRSEDEYAELVRRHHIASIPSNGIPSNGIPLGGWSAVPRGGDSEARCDEVSAVWTSDPSDAEQGFQSGGMGPRILAAARAVADEARTSLYALTSSALAKKLFVPSGFTDRGNLRALQEQGKAWTDHLRSYDPERAKSRTVVTYSGQNDN